MTSRPLGIRAKLNLGLGFVQPGHRAVKRPVSLVSGLLLAVAVIPIALPGVALLMGVRLNLSHSMPRGFYRETAPSYERGTWIVLCLPKRAAVLALERHYIGRGACPGGAGKILKQIIAVPGDRVALDAHGLRINGLRVPGTGPTAADNHGRPLDPLEFSETLLPLQSYWVGGTNPARSWDSRYFGPVRKDLIVARAHPLLLFADDSIRKR